MKRVVSEIPCALSGHTACETEPHTMLEIFPPSFKSQTQWVFAGLAPEQGALHSLCRALSGIALIQGRSICSLGYTSSMSIFIIPYAYLSFI